MEGNKEDIEKAISEGLGVMGVGDAKPIFISKGKNIIVGVERGELDRVLGAFEICKEKINVRKVSGTIKGLGHRNL